MSFFFQTAKKERSKRAASARPKPTTKAIQNVKTLNRLGCKVCPLANEGQKVETQHAKKDCLIYFLGEAPGAEEEKKGRPFVGKSGKFLRSMVDDEYRKHVAYGNVVFHRPPNNRTPTWHETECCRGYSTAAIEQARPRVIVGLGTTALQWALGSTDMVGMRGRLFVIKVGEHVCYFYPTYHPSFILRQATEKKYSDPLIGAMGGCFKLDFQRLFDMVENLPDPHLLTAEEIKKDVETFNGNSFDRLMEHFDLCNKAKEMSIDLETYPLRPYAEEAVLITASVSYFNKKGKLSTFAFVFDKERSKWTEQQLKAIKSKLKVLLLNKKLKKIAHNVPFEMEWLINEYGLEIVDHDNWEDTMLQAHVIDERKGKGKEEDRRPVYQNLDFLCRMYFGLALKSVFKLNKKDMRKNKIEDVLLYNGCDTYTTLLLFHKQKQVIKEQGIQKIYEFAMPRQNTVAVMQGLGMLTDQEKLKEFSKKLGNDLDKIKDKILNLKVIKRYIKDNGQFNPNDSKGDVLTVFKDYLKREEVKIPIKYAKKDESNYSYSVDKNVLEKVDHPLAPLILKHRNKTKIKSTNVDAFILGVGTEIYPDYKIHTNFNTTFTTTGRTSSDEPNLQNWPKREDAWVREAIIAEDGYIIVAIDYGQLEWCMACVCSRDKAMVKATWNDYDVHMFWAKRIAKDYPKAIGGKKNFKDEKVMKKFRSKVKNKMVFPCIFGAANESVAGYLNMKEQQGIVNRFMGDFWDEFSGLKRWQDNLMKDYYETGYVENLMGRRRRYPMSRNEAINFPIQSLASEIVVDSMNTLSRLAIETGEMHLHPRLNIHDDLTFCIPDDPRILEDSIDTIYRVMLDLPYDFINVPLSVEVSIGYNWYEMEEVQKFWSHKDL